MGWLNATVCIAFPYTCTPTRMLYRTADNDIVFLPWQMSDSFCRQLETCGWMTELQKQVSTGFITRSGRCEVRKQYIRAFVAGV